MKHWWSLTAILTLGRLLAAAAVPLGDDEGYYWVWSRHLAAGYYDHPPLVAWLVAVSTRLLGVSLLSLRLPFVLLGAGSVLALRALVREVTGDAALADRSALLFQALPIFFALGVLVIPDGPLLFFWLLAARALWRACRDLSPRHWLAAGLLLGGALLSKYVAVLLPASAAAYLAGARGRRAWHGLAAACGIAILVASPVAWWNAHHHWASFQYQFVTRHHGAGFEAGRLALYLGSQALYLSPIWAALIGWALLSRARRQAWARQTGDSFLWWLAAPTAAVFLAAAALTSFKPNWAAPGYATALPLALRDLSRWRGRAPRVAAAVWWAAWGVALAGVLTIVAHSSRPFLPLARELDPTADMRGWSQAAAAAERARAALVAESGPLAAPPFYAAGRYQNASRLEFYLPGHPPVVCLDPGRDAYDDWQRLDALQGRDFVFVADDRFSAEPGALTRLRAARLFARIAAPAGPRAAHVLSIYTCQGFGAPAESARAARAPSRTR